MVRCESRFVVKAVFQGYGWSKLLFYKLNLLNWIWRQKCLMFKTRRVCSHDFFSWRYLWFQQTHSHLVHKFPISGWCLWIVECSMNLLKGIIWGDPTRTLAIPKADGDLCDYLDRSGLYFYPAFKCCLSEPEQTLLPLDVVVQHLVHPFKCIPAFVTQRPNACQLRGT